MESLKEVNQIKNKYTFHIIWLMKENIHSLLRSFLTKDMEGATEGSSNWFSQLNLSSRN